jgi:hypothetical protein
LNKDEYEEFCTDFSILASEKLKKQESQASSQSSSQQIIENVLEAKINNSNIPNASVKLSEGLKQEFSKTIKISL